MGDQDYRREGHAYGRLSDRERREDYHHHVERGTGQSRGRSRSRSPRLEDRRWSHDHYNDDYKRSAYYEKDSSVDLRQQSRTREEKYGRTEGSHRYDRDARDPYSKRDGREVDRDHYKRLFRDYHHRTSSPESAEVASSRHRRGRSPSASPSSPSESYSSESSDTEVRPSNRKKRTRSRSRSRSHSRERSKTRSKRKDKDQKKQDKKKHKDKKKDKLSSERRSVLTGKKIKLKVRKDAADIERDANREHLLQFLNSTYQ